MVGSIFFFQAEDGIRDLVRSRGLGDVYKRQVVAGQTKRLIINIAPRYGKTELVSKMFIAQGLAPVSYTHLTLPTIYSV